MNGRMMRGGVVLAVAAALTMSGCADAKGGGGAGGDSVAGATTAAEAPKEAKEALLAAVKKLQEDTFKSTIKLGAAGTMIGVMDPAKKIGEFTMKGESEGTSIKTEMRMIAGTNYIRITMKGTDLPGMDGKTWRKMNSTGGVGTLGGYDPTDTVKSLESAADVKWAGDNAVEGTLDLAKAGKQLGMGATQLDKLTTKVIPFEAGFDGDGRLVRYVLTTPAVGSEAPTKMEMNYSDFGLPVEVEAPPASEIAKG